MQALEFFPIPLSYQCVVGISQQENSNAVQMDSPFTNMVCLAGQYGM